MQWWVRYENDDGEYEDDGPFPSREVAAQHAVDWQIPYLILNDEDREASEV